MVWVLFWPYYSLVFLLLLAWDTGYTDFVSLWTMFHHHEVFAVFLLVFLLRHSQSSLSIPIPRFVKKKKIRQDLVSKVFEILCSGQRILMWLFWCFIWDKKDNSADLRGLLPLYFIGSYSLRLSSKGWSQTDPPVQATGAGSLLQDQWDTKSQHRTFHLKLAADNLKFFVGVTVLWK